MDQERNKTGGSGGTSGWSPTSQPGPASGRSSITPAHSGGATGRVNTPDEETDRSTGSDNSLYASGGRQPGSRLTDVAEEIRTNARQLKHEATNRGGEMLHDMQDRMAGAFDQGKGRIANEVCAIGDLLKDAAGRLEGEHGAVGRYARMAADQVTDLGDYLRNADPERLVSEFQSFARRRPEIFLGGAIVTGLLLGRFLRSHRPRYDYGGLNQSDSARFGYDEDFADSNSGGGASYGRATRMGSGGNLPSQSTTGIGSAVSGAGSSNWSAGSSGGAGYSTTGGAGGTGYSSSGPGGSNTGFKGKTDGGNSSPAI